MNDTLENIFISTESFDSETLQTDPETLADKHLSLNDEDIVALFFARDEGAIAAAREKYGLGDSTRASLYVILYLTQTSHTTFPPTRSRIRLTPHTDSF